MLRRERLEAEAPLPIDAPRKRGRPKGSKAKDEIEQAATVGVFSLAVSSIFIPLSVVFGAHWALEDHEANALAESLQKALSTLPGSTYVDLKKYLDKYTPWVALTITAARIVAPRIEETQRLRAEQPGDEFPSAIESPIAGNASPPVWGRQDVDGHGPQAGRPDPFGTYPGAD